MAFPSEEAKTLRPHPIAALGQYLAWFFFPRGWYSEVYLIWVYHSSSLLSAFPLTPAPHLEQDFLWHYPCIFTCPLNLSESGCAHSRAQSHALLELQASACAWPPWLPAEDCSRCPLSPLLWVFLHLILPILHPSTFCNILLPSTVLFLTITKGSLGERTYSNSSLFSLCQKPAEFRSKTDSEQVFLFFKTYNTGKAPGLLLVSHLYLQKHLYLANIVDHFYIAFKFCYFFKSGIISNLFDFQKDSYLLYSLLFCCPFFIIIIILHYRECEILWFLLIWQL